MDPRALESRVADLEKQVRKSKVFGRAACVVACAVLASSALPQSRFFQRIRQLEIYDGQGRTRIVMDANPVPRLVFKSETGENQIVLGIGDQERSFSFGEEQVPHLALQTGHTSILLSVSPAPQSETLEEHVRVESAALQMSSWRDPEGQPQGKQLIALISPNRANLAISTHDQENLASSEFDPGVKLFVDENGQVETKLGDEEEK